jgi:signal transduction histidine kinase
MQQADVRCLAEAPDGTLWVGMRGGGFARFRDAGFEQFRSDRGLPYDYVWALHVDGEGAVWIGTSGGGLIRRLNNTFTHFTTSAGLPSDFICQIEDDGMGNLWIGSYAGIFRVSKAELDRKARGEIRTVNCLVLDQTEGMTSLEMSGGNQPASCRTEDGQFWFATSAGLAVVDPERIQLNDQPPPVWIELVLADGIPCPPTEDKSKEDAPPIVRIAPGTRQTEFDYTALSLSAPQRVRFRHRLTGLDKEWVEAGNRREVIYSHLPPGNYRFEVIACNNHGIWNTAGAAIRVRVLPHFWQTWWFAPACWLGGLGLFGGAVLTTLRRSHRRRVEILERESALERERTRIAQDLHDDLGAGLTEVDSTSAVGADESVTAEEAREFFREIGTRSREMIGALDEIVWAVNPKNDTLSSLASYMCQFAEQFLKPTSIRVRFDVPAHLPALHLNSEQRYNLFLACKEALHNAARHSGAAEIRLRIAARNNILNVCVEDDGSGLTPDVEGRRRPDADGLDNMRERMERLGGQCRIDGESGRGTRVMFTLNLGREDSHR